MQRVEGIAQTGLRHPDNSKICKSCLIRSSLKYFQNSEFIKSFPVIILACGPYIKNNEDRQIDKYFHVKYDGDETGKYCFTPTIWFYTHHSDDGSKKQLVIHTRQFSTFYGKVDELIKGTEKVTGMAEVIREHLRIE